MHRYEYGALVPMHMLEATGEISGTQQRLLLAYFDWPLAVNTVNISAI